MKCYGVCKCLTAEVKNAGTPSWVNDAIYRNWDLGGIASAAMALTLGLLALKKTRSITIPDNDYHFQED